MSYHIGLALLGTVIGLLALCLVILVGDRLRTQLNRWREKRAIARRDASQAKREAEMRRWGFLAYPRPSNYIPRASLDSHHRTGQFSVGRDVRDIPGVHR